MPVDSAVTRSVPAGGRGDDRHPVGAGQRLRAAEPHQRARDCSAAAVVVVAAHRHAQRRARGDGRALGPRLQRPLAAAGAVLHAPEPQQPPAAQPLPVAERTRGIGGAGRPHAPPDLVDPAARAAARSGPTFRTYNDPASAGERPQEP